MSAAVLCLIAITLVATTSYAQQPPPRPIIPEDFVTLLAINYTTFDGSTSIRATEHYAVAAPKRLVTNLTDNENTFHVTQLAFYDSEQGYEITWNKDVTNGTCKSYSPGNYDFIFGWLTQASFTGYIPFFDWETWTYSPNQETFAFLAVPARSRFIPITMVFRNQTADFEVAFLAFQAMQPPEEYFTLPSSCQMNKQQGQLETAAHHDSTTSTATHHAPPLAMLHSVMHTVTRGGPNVIRGDYTKTMHPIAKEMLNRFMNRF